MRLALTVFAAAGVASAFPQTPSMPPPSFKITNVVSGGTGCPQGSIDLHWTDSKVLPICKSCTHLPCSATQGQNPKLNLPDYGKDFTATVGPKADITNSRRFCQLNIELAYSAGFSFAVYSAEYNGFADLDSGVDGTVKSTYYFSGETDQVRRSQLATYLRNNLRSILPSRRLY